MMPYQSRSSSRLQSRLQTARATWFETPPLHNQVYDELGDDAQLRAYCDAAGEADVASDVRRKSREAIDEASIEALDGAWARLVDVAETRADEVVAAVCARFIKEGDTWVAEDLYEREVVSDARYEARSWLQTHLELAERVGVVDVAESESGGQSVEGADRR